MRKYLWVLLPLAVCWGFALAASRVAPDTTIPYRDAASLHAISVVWFLIGWIVSGVVVAVLAIDDLFELCRRWRKRRYAERIDKERHG